MGLQQYRAKRDFQKTPEPVASRTRSNSELKFVVQKHAARRLHYDFRLEVNGVLVSWAVPKGPSLNTGDKRLAVQTEDHPFDYRNFEGVIPAGQYGGGPVIIWDEGTYAPEIDGRALWHDRRAAEKLMQEGLRKGKLTVFLRGKKLHGSWTLFRLHNKDKDWILLKHRDGFVDPERDITSEGRSVVSGRTIEETRVGRMPADPVHNSDEVTSATRAKFPRETDPMLASPAESAFDREGWIYEPKLDGIRAIAGIKDGEVTLTSRRGLDLTRSYPELAKQLSAHPQNVVFDGEIIALDEAGRPSFQMLQQRSGLTRASDVKRAGESTPVHYYVFDIVYLDKSSLLKTPLLERKKLLEETLIQTDRIRLVEAMDTDGVTAFKAATKAGLEGIVAKRLNSVYEPGKRSKAWVKVKGTDSLDLVICGYTEGTGARKSTFGALILGYYHRGQLTYAGGCGTGFDAKTLTMLDKQLTKLKTTKSPFSHKIPGKTIHWIKPELVAEIKFAEWTRDGILRSPVFLHLRPDKAPTECVR